jgi:hypothetical protein
MDSIDDPLRHVCVSVTVAVGASIQSVNIMKGQFTLLAVGLVVAVCLSAALADSDRLQVGVTVR